MTDYIYDLGGNLIAEADGGTGAVTAEYVALEGNPLAWIATAAIYWVHGDHLGTPQMLTDASGAVVWDADYRPFGAATVTGALTFNLRFPGQYEDAETGLHYNTFRDYDARLGRYIQSDPIGLGGGWNTYGYVGGNPVMRVDPEGLFQMCPPGSRDDGADYLQPGCGAGPETWGGPKAAVAGASSRINRQRRIKIRSQEMSRNRNPRCHLFRRRPKNVTMITIVRNACLTGKSRTLALIPTR